jgi:hypothetical protein
MQTTKLSNSVVGRAARVAAPSLRRCVVAPCVPDGRPHHGNSEHHAAYDASVVDEVTSLAGLQGLYQRRHDAAADHTVLQQHTPAQELQPKYKTVMLKVWRRRPMHLQPEAGIVWLPCGAGRARPN